MINFVEPGNTVLVVAPRALKSGDGVVVSKMFGIATTDAKSGAVVPIAIEGVVEVNKGSTSPNPGDAVGFDETTQKLIATGGKVIGLCIVGASPDNAANAWVKLIPSPA